jgi:O-antigen/teichoic acid export membrane protein
MYVWKWLMGVLSKTTRSKERFRQGFSAAIAFGARSLQQIVTLFITLLAARFLTPAEYGTYTLSALFVAFFQALIYAGAYHYIIRTKGDQEEIRDTCFWIMMTMAVAGTIVLLLAAPFLAWVFRAPDMVSVLRLLALLQPLFALTAWCSAVLMRGRRTQLLFRLIIVENLIGLTVGVVLLMQWQSIFALVAYRAAQAVGATLLFLGIGGTYPRFRFSRQIASDAMRFSSHLYGTRTLNFIANYGADITLGLLFSTAEAGLYRFGSRIATGATDIIAQPMRTFALSQFGAAFREVAPFGPLLQRLASTMVVLMVCVSGTLIVFGADLTNMFLQPSYAGALVVMYALAVRSVLGVGNTFIEPVLASQGHTGALLKHQALWTAVRTIAIPLSAGFGLWAVGWSQAAISVLVTVSAMRLMARLGQIDVRPVIRGLGQSVLFGLGYTVLALLIHWLVLSGDDVGRSDLFLALGLSGLAGLLTMLAAIRWRVLHLQVFSG